MSEMTVAERLEKIKQARACWEEAERILIELDPAMQRLISEQSIARYALAEMEEKAYAQLGREVQGELSTRVDRRS